MTGEVTLRGRVLPIGGLKEKLLAALRSGIKTVLIPEENTRDLKEIPEIVTKGMEIIPVARMDQVLKVALIKEPEAIEWTYDEKANPPASIDPPEGDEATSLPH
jgi:ATP-dependent Lon protease